MIIRTGLLGKICDKILSAVDNSDMTSITETLELQGVNGNLYLNVTNREYFVKVKVDGGATEDFHASVSADVFLKLIPRITTEDIELELNDNHLEIKGNGSYKLPLIYDNDKVLTLPAIDINNITGTFDISTETLRSIDLYNSKELTKGIISKPVQRYFYVDNQGAITFTSGACVNNFAIDTPVKMLLNLKTVKLFKLFEGETVKVEVGQDVTPDGITQSKARFSTENVILTSITTSDDSLLGSVPVDAIRKRANETYMYSVELDKDELLQAINRFLLFNQSNATDMYCKFVFDNNKLSIQDKIGGNSEVLPYNQHLDITEPYEAMLELKGLKSTLETCKIKYINVAFGNHTAIVIDRKSVV